MIFAAEAEARLGAVRAAMGDDGIELRARIRADVVTVAILAPRNLRVISVGEGPTFGCAVERALVDAERETNDGGSQ